MSGLWVSCSLAQVVYKEREKIEGMIKKSMPLLKGFSEFQYGFKIRDKENPKNWCGALSTVMRGFLLLRR